VQTAIVIFSKVPLPGKTKSRLQGILSAEECALFHRACLIDLHRTVQKTAMKAFLYITGGGREEFALGFPAPVPEEFGELYLLQLEGIAIRQQHGGDLGQRLYHAADQVLRLHRQVILVGSDLPDLTEDLLLAVVNSLEDHEVVAGPAQDGGYYLLGLKHAYPVLFQGIDWGTSRVLEQTMQAARGANLRVALLPFQRDIDTWQDLVAYVRRGRQQKEAERLLSFRLAAHLTAKHGFCWGKDD